MEEKDIKLIKNFLGSLKNSLMAMSVDSVKEDTINAVFNNFKEIVEGNMPEPVESNKILYTVVEGGTKPESTWITKNCSENVFDESTGKGYLLLNDGVIELGDVFESSKEVLTVIIPTQITSIGEYAFYDCSNLTSIIIPDSVTSIGDSAFNNCYSLASIVIPDSVTSIGDSVFESCESLTSVVHIPDSVTSIGNGAFQYANQITSINIPNSVTEIGNRAFNYCSSLTSIVIPDSVTSIGYEAFSGCSGLTSIVIPNSVTVIEKWTFAGCEGLTSVHIPDSVTEIEKECFSRCSNLTSVTCNALTPPTLGTNNFTAENDKLYVPAESVETYKATNWNTAFNGSIFAK